MEKELVSEKFLIRFIGAEFVFFPLFLMALAYWAVH
jgi:hypothetical protein